MKEAQALHDRGRATVARAIWLAVPVTDGGGPDAERRPWRFLSVRRRAAVRNRAWRNSTA